MGAPSEACVCTLDFTGLPKCMRITKSSERLNDGVKSTEVAIEVSCELSTDPDLDPDLLLAFSQMPSCSISFPRKFFDQNIVRNVKGFLAVLESCLLSPESRLNTNERSSNTQDDPSAKSAIPHGSNDAKSSAEHAIVKEESASQTPSGEAIQVNQATALDVTTPGVRLSRNSSKSSAHKPIQVSNDSSTPLESPHIKRKNLITHKPISKASARSPDRSEKMKLVPTGLKKVTMSSVLDKELDHEWVKIVEDVVHPKTVSSNEDTADSSDFSIVFKGYLSQMDKCPCPKEGLKLCKVCGKYWHYIENHLRDMKCPHIDCPLWKLCFKKKQYSLYKDAPYKLILFSRKSERIGTISYDYDGYNIHKPIGEGGFAKVYKHMAFAVKEEPRASSLISDLVRFAEVLNFSHPNVMYLEEYVIGYSNHGDKGDKSYPEAPLLFIMTHYNQQGLNAPFRDYEKLKSLLDYMSFSKGQEDYVFRNFLVIAVDLFNALEYFRTKGLVHRDVKRSNILLKLACNCPSAIECICRGRGKVTALLSDFDLIEKATSDGKWARLGDHEPSGTDGMKALELFFIDKKGADCFTAKADVWSAFLTLIYVLLGKSERIVPLEKVTEFFADINSGVNDSPKQLQNCVEELQSYCDEHKDGDHQKIIQVIKVLQRNQNNIKQMCRFQNGEHMKKDYIYCPAGEILTAVHVACTMPQVCITKVEHIFQSNNPLQETMKETWKILQSGMCFRPEGRPDIKEVVEMFTSCLNNFLKNGAFSYVK